MRVPLSWIKEIVETDSNVEELAEKLSMAGFEVEEIIDRSSYAAGVVVGFIEEIQPHPNADKLNLCKVNVGTQEPIEIVCGASNVKASIYVPVALIGAELKAINLKIKRSKLRGVESHGMICSLKELGLESNSDGIYIFDENSEEKLTPGEPVAQLFGLDDQILDIAITANRPDGMSIKGIALEVSSLVGSKINTINNNNSHELNELVINYNNTKYANCESYSLIEVKNINNNISTPNMIRHKLEKCGINSINPIVDITNLIMLQEGQPMHAFDVDLLAEITRKNVDKDSFEVGYARKGEKFIGLDHKEVVLTAENLVVYCNNVIVALAGVIGALNCGVNKNTKSIFLESAVFSQEIIRKSSRIAGIRTESSSRFERGVPKENTLTSAMLAAQYIKNLLGGEVVNVYKLKDMQNISKPINLRRDFIHSTLGPVEIGINNKTENQNKTQDNDNKLIVGYENISDELIQDTLLSLHFDLKKIESGWLVNVPIHRRKDVTREIDLIEEIARLIGFDNFSSNLPDPIAPGGLNNTQKVTRQIRSNFCAAGLQEIVTMSLVPGNEELNTQIKVINPLLAEASALRTNLWEEHIRIAERNLKSFQTNCWIYEIGKIYQKSSEGSLIEQEILAGLICGNRTMGYWKHDSDRNTLDYYSARGLINKSLIPLKVELSDKPITNDNRLHPGRACSLSIEGKDVGVFGEVHPKIRQKSSLLDNTYIFEIKLDAITNTSTRKSKLNPIFKPFPTVPFMERDISIVVDNNILANDIVNVIIKAGRPLLEQVDLIDRYEGDNLPNDKCSQAFRIRYRSKDKTLTDEILEPIHEKIRKELTRVFRAELRS